MANIALTGSAAELGISAANLWIQPGNKANGYDALEGEKQFFADPLGVDPALIPVGITFPSAKELSPSEQAAEAAAAAKAKSAGGAPNADGPYHTCQILALAEHAWFNK